MRKSREQMEADERAQLASYAQKSAESAGRAHLDPPHAYRTEYQRDRARVIHSRAFRRLEYKTQVFLNGSGDHLRTRLTHTIEVASISRTIARALGLNEDLAEAIALAHDLGHPPFGHPGEETLAVLMQGHGGFDHNVQSLRIVELIESDYARFPGLNLSFEVVEGLRKHQPFYEWNNARYTCPSLEAQIANLADEITYNSHDIDDGLDAGLISVDGLSGLALWQQAEAQMRKEWPDLQGSQACSATIRRIIEREVEDVISTSAANIARAGIVTPEDVRRQPAPLVCYSDSLMADNREIKKFLFDNLYYHPQVRRANVAACERLAEVFEAYVRSPESMGETALSRMESEGLHRTVCDYLSGMTDRYLLQEHARLFGEL